MPGNKKEGSKRTLVRWSDDLDKQLLLSIQYACNEAGLRIPWDNVARLMGEKFSDGAIVQHLSKLRGKMVENQLPVPPPLKRGTTVVPSKIYATSGTARRKSMPESPNTAITTPKSKPGASRKRNRRSGLDSDSDSQPDENDMDIADTSDDEYGASGKKKKKKRHQRQAKAKQATKEKAIQEPIESDHEDAKEVNKEDVRVKSQAVEEETIQESIETPGPASRTRGVKTDYSQIDDASDEDEDVIVDDVKDESVTEGGDDQAAVGEDEMEDPKIKSDGEVSPRSKVPVAPATPAPSTPAHLTNFPAFNRSPYSGHSFGQQPPYLGAGMQYQSPQNIFPGIPPMNYLTRSNMTSFSTNRNDSASSLTSPLQPTFSSHSSFSHAPMNQMPVSSHSDYFGHTGLDFNNIGSGFEHDMHHGGHMLRSDEDDHEEFEHLFNNSRQG